MLSDTAHYGAALAALREAEALAQGNDDVRQVAYAASMSGRALLLLGDLDAATEALDRSLTIAQQVWAAFLPWPLSLRAEVDLLRADIDAAAERFDHAFALGCHLGDPCWEGISGRWRGRVAVARGETGQAVEMLVDSIARAGRLPDAYVWGRAYCLDALCELAAGHAMPQAAAWIDELQRVAARSGMRELTVREHLHRAELGESASGTAACLLAREIDNPRLVARAAATGRSCA